MSEVVNIEQLRSVANLLLDHISSQGDENITLENDFYWWILKEAAYDAYSEPGEFTIGQLSSDLTNLKDIADGNAEPIGYALVWLSSVFRAVGENVIG